MQAQPDALIELYDRYGRLVYSVSLSVVRVGATAEEVTLDVFQKVPDAAGLPVALVNPIRVRYFGKAYGQYAKTDKLDARLIASFAAMMKPPVRPSQGREQAELAPLVQPISMVFQRPERNRQK